MAAIREEPGHSSYHVATIKQAENRASPRLFPAVDFTLVFYNRRRIAPHTKLVAIPYELGLVILGYRPSKRRERHNIQRN